MKQIELELMRIWFSKLTFKWYRKLSVVIVWIIMNVTWILSNVPMEIIVVNRKLVNNS